MHKKEGEISEHIWLEGLGSGMEIGKGYSYFNCLSRGFFFSFPIPEKDWKCLDPLKSNLNSLSIFQILYWFRF